MPADFGGHMRLTLDGSPLVIRGKFEIEGTNMESSIVTNEDGSISQIAKPKALMIGVDFEDTDPSSGLPVDWQAIVFGAAAYNIMIAEEDTGVTHMLTGAKFGGKPRIDRLTGQVTGLEMHVSRNGYHKTKG